MCKQQKFGVSVPYPRPLGFLPTAAQLRIFLLFILWILRQNWKLVFCSHVKSYFFSLSSKTEDNGVNSGDRWEFIRTRLANFCNQDKCDFWIYCCPYETSNRSQKNRTMGNPRYDPFRRHYKKDTRFLLDLYTLTYDSGESLCTVDSKVGEKLCKAVTKTSQETLSQLKF